MPGKRLTLIALLLTLMTGGAVAQPLTIGYSDWPGWVAWEIAIEKQWFQEAGVDVRFEWFDYVASMDAFAAGQLDAVAMTNGDTLVTGASGAMGTMILINDYSNGNDMIVARPGISSTAELRGKKIGVEVGFVSHLLLLNALEAAGLAEADVELVNVPTNETPQVLASGEVDAIVAWQPNSSQALALVPGSTAIYTSRDQPGLIYDVLAVKPASLAADRQAWLKVVNVWYRVVDYLADPATKDNALAIMAARVGLPPAAYEPLLAGTKILSRQEVAQYLQPRDGYGSIYGSSRVSDAFNTKHAVYSTAQNVNNYIDTSLMLEQ
jgi:NitT/TauT family transport system substrate-binding protein